MLRFARARRRSFCSVEQPPKFFARLASGLRARCIGRRELVEPVIGSAGIDDRDRVRGSAGESHEPSMNWIDSFGSVRVSIAQIRFSRLVTSTSSSVTTIYFEA